MNEWLNHLPKVELHLHIDGTLQAARMLELANKNAVPLPYQSVDEVLAAYDFEDLQSFLDLYYMGASVLQDEEDFYHLMMDYLLKCKEQHILHTEIMVEPQTYAPNGVEFATMMKGFNKAIRQAEDEWGQSVLLILSFLRHLSEEECLETLKQAEPFRENFVAIGLASSEKDNPPEKFVRLYEAARAQGYKAVAHAGEEGPASYVSDSLDILKVQRVDHGVRSVENDELMQRLAKERIPLTVCPLSNVRLCVFEKMADHNILDMLEKGLCVTVNSDDPAYFGGYLNENFQALATDLGMTREQAAEIVKNSFEASFLSDEKKKMLIAELEDYLLNNE